eukprot:365289-Chlamydomonas_euryale.AAC.5
MLHGGCRFTAMPTDHVLHWACGDAGVHMAMNNAPPKLPPGGQQKAPATYVPAQPDAAPHDTAMQGASMGDIFSSLFSKWNVEVSTTLFSLTHTRFLFKHGLYNA